KEFLDAKQYCFRLLRVRQRSKAELATRLKQKKYSIGTTKRILQYLAKISLVDDAKFTREWIEQRLNNNYGKNRIILELKIKGVPDALIDDQLRSALDNYDESEVANRQAQKYIKLYRNLEPSVIQRRLYGHLIRKGFSEGTVQNIVNHYDNERNS
ncbi:MAG: regulatory protein RecX, partial [Candidatus Omnitrophica bacterium]|nr:regulatory protein RecX [Candidatus Omnitrophota bacterium]